MVDLIFIILFVFLAAIVGLACAVFWLWCRLSDHFIEFDELQVSVFQNRESNVPRSLTSADPPGVCERPAGSVCELKRIEKEKVIANGYE